MTRVDRQVPSQGRGGGAARTGQLPMHLSQPYDAPFSDERIALSKLHLHLKRPACLHCHVRLVRPRTIPAQHPRLSSIGYTSSSIRIKRYRPTCSSNS
jgi:hypothetical protein